MISTKHKLFWMFSPLVLAFGLLGLGINDMKHPVTNKDSCHYVGRGGSIKAFKAQARTLITSSGKEIDDIGLQCKDLGKVLINQNLMLPVKPGHPISLTRKQYQYLPDRYYIQVPVINPDEAEVSAGKAPSSTPSMPLSHSR